MIELLPLQSQVVVDGEISATVVAVELRGSPDNPQTSYKCSWWDERTLKSEWFTEAELKVSGSSRLRVGF